MTLATALSESTWRDTEGAVFDQHASLGRREKKVARRDATEQRLTPMISPPSLHDLIVSQGYRLVEDAWESNGRRTYLHDEDADRAFLNKLKRDLQILEWKADRNKLRTFGHARSGEVIEIEPGGSDTSGHFLHHMKAFD
jgi:hypothetical protein